MRRRLRWPGPGWCGRSAPARAAAAVRARAAGTGPDAGDGSRPAGRPRPTSTGTGSEPQRLRATPDLGLAARPAACRPGGPRRRVLVRGVEPAHRLGGGVPGVAQQGEGALEVLQRAPARPSGPSTRNSAGTLSTPPTRTAARSPSASIWRTFMMSRPTPLGRRPAGPATRRPAPRARRARRGRPSPRGPGRRPGADRCGRRSRDRATAEGCHARAAAPAPGAPSGTGPASA